MVGGPGQIGGKSRVKEYLGSGAIPIGLFLPYFPHSFIHSHGVCVPCDPYLEAVCTGGCASQAGSSGASQTAGRVFSASMGTQNHGVPGTFKMDF